jgi:hypothetical protein
VEQIHPIAKGLAALVVLVIIGLIAWVVIEFWQSESHPYSAPASFTVSNDAVAKVVRDAIAGDLHATPLNGSPVVNCTGETTCTIGYTVQAPTGALIETHVYAEDQQVILPTRQMWKALFSDARFQYGTITVSGPVKTIGGETETGTYYTLTCDRNSASQINWDNVDGNGLRTLCDYHGLTDGLPG